MNRIHGFPENHCRCFVRGVLFFLPIIVLLSCSSPRYVVVDSRDDVNLYDGDTRYICLNKDDAQTYKNILGLHSNTGVSKYYQTNKINTPVGEVLYSLISGQYHAAHDSLTKNWDAIPDYLRLLIKADLASEIDQEKITSRQLVGMYQEAFEAQTVNLNRDLIKVRIRQLRYGR